MTFSILKPAERVSNPPVITTARMILRLGRAEDVPEIVRFHRDNEAFLAPWTPRRKADCFTESYWRVQVEAAMEAGIPVHFERKGGRETIAHVVDCQPMGSGQPGWMLAAQLDRPDNFWGLKPCPQDWMQLPETVASSSPVAMPTRSRSTTRANRSR